MTIKAKLKSAFTFLLYISGLSPLCFFWLRVKYKNQYIRAILYHETLASNRDNFIRHLNYLRNNFHPINLAELKQFLSGQLKLKKPGIIICFDDALRSQFDVAAPLLKERGFFGWFMVPAGIITPTTKQEIIKNKSFQETHSPNDKENRVLMSWEEINALQVSGHIIGCHTKTHCRLNDGLEYSQLREEIVHAKHQLEDKINAEVSVFSWVGGEPHNRGKNAADLIKEAGFDCVFLTHMKPIVRGCSIYNLQRTSLNDDYSLYTLRYYLSGISDVLAFRERKKALHYIEGRYMAEQL